MFGLMRCNKKTLSKEEAARYQSTYCGLCRVLGNRYGQWERMAVNYDMTFLAILLNGLYEADNEEKEFLCPVHPLKEQRAFGSRYLDYAADMTILLTYYKCLDDWTDEKKHLQKSYGNHLQKHMVKLRLRYPRQVAGVEESLKTLSELEKKESSALDEVVNCSGKMLSEIFVFEEDFWKGVLWQFGYEMGRFIYLMDAVLDYEYDRKKIIITR